MRDLLSLRSERHGAREALRDDARAWTYAALDAEAARLAGALARAGVGPGDRVATHVAEPAAHVVALHAAWRLGATVLPLHARATPEEVVRATTLTRASVVVTDAARTEAAAPPEVPVVPASARDAPAEPARRGLDDLAALVLTSGTTGEPRAARLLWRNLLSSAAASAERLETRASDRWLLALPLAHVAGLSVVVRATLQGASVLAPAKADVAATDDAIERGAASVVPLVPTQLRRLLDSRGARRFPPTLRVLLLGGAPAPRGLVAEARALGAPVRRTYGLTEAASQVATEDAAGRLLPLRRVEVRVEAGAVLVRGPTVADGYEGDAAATREIFHDGWLRTRDAGALGADGALVVHGRLDDLINTGGEKVAPSEVESALLAHESVADACVVGLPDAEWGERVAAAVVLRPGARADGLDRHLRARLPPAKVPRVLRFVEALPRTESGKVRRSAVRDLLRQI